MRFNQPLPETNPPFRLYPRGYRLLFLFPREQSSGSGKNKRDTRRDRKAERAPPRCSSLSCYTETLLRVCLLWKHAPSSLDVAEHAERGGFPRRNIIHRAHASIHRVTIRFRCPARNSSSRKGKSWQTSLDWLRANVFETALRSFLFRPLSTLSPFFRETRIKRRADQIVGPILVSPHLFSASIEFVCPLWVATVETDDGITIEGSRMILEVFRGGEGEVVEFRLTLDDRWIKFGSGVDAKDREIGVVWKLGRFRDWIGILYLIKEGLEEEILLSDRNK